MRTTVTLDNDVARAVEELRRTEGLATSAAVNALARRGLSAPAASSAEFVQRSSPMGIPRIGLDDVGAALEFLDEAERA